MDHAPPKSAPDPAVRVSAVGLELELTIDAVSYGGRGVARHGEAPGKVYFVEDAIVGDRVLARVTEDNGRYGDAAVIQTIMASPLRGPSPCKVSDACGGCQWLGVPYPSQLEWKASFVKAALTRIGKLPSDVEIEMIGSPTTLGFRNRILVRLHHDGGRHAKLGYFARRSRTLVPLDRCEVAEPQLNGLLERLASMDLSDVPAFKARLEIQRVPEDGVEPEGVLVTVYPADGPRAAAGTLAQRIGALKGVRWAGLIFDVDAAAPVVLERDMGLAFATTPGQFQQVNMALNRHLRRLVKTEVDRLGAKRILDVFCGSGNLSLPLAGEGRYVEGVEFNRRAIEVAKRNAQAAGLKGVTYIAGDATKHLWKCARGGERFDVVLLDPPRQGMYEGMVPLKKLEPEAILYVSCDPTTLARDLGYLTRKDAYKIARVTALDFFPNSYHIETLVLLTR